jgi:opacity protein-like surface antigen
VKWEMARALEPMVLSICFSGVCLMRKFYTAGIAAFLAFGMTNVQAADIEDDDNPNYEGAYIVARIAGAFNNNSEFSLAVKNYTTDVLTEYEDLSYAGAAAVGYRFQDMFSIEVEGGYTEFQAVASTLLAVPTAQSTTTARFDGANAGGAVKVSYGMINIVTEQDTGTFIRPYLSMGIGAAQVDVQDLFITLPAPIDPLPVGKATLIDDTEISYAWQIGTGVILDITKNLALEAGYRYFRVEDVDLNTKTNNETPLNLSQHQALLGVRVSF